MKKIYTRTGDRGTTGLFGSGRVEKHHPRVEAYGTVDEANAFIGQALAQLPDEDALEPLAAVLRRVQEELFVVGADLATPPDARSSVPRIEAVHVERLERDIDRFQEDLPALKHFILPGGAPAGAALHAARTVCRRAERRTAAARASDDTIGEQVLVYLNRLSDLLFVLARWTNRLLGAEEAVWMPAQ